jgi:glycosidase/MoaA/NifB/PqqE/SkfB family radical SAM enzyme
MQVKKEQPFRHPIETIRIVVNVSWDTSDAGSEIPRLVGEWSDWEDATAPALVSDDGAASFEGDLPATFRATAEHALRGTVVLALEQGVYGYKLKTSRGYFLNREEPRTLTRDFITNNVLSVGGTPEPLLHAPAPPFVHFASEGGVIVRAMARKWSTRTLRVAWSESGEHGCETAMALRAVDEGASASHDHFEVHLPASTETLHYRFLLDDGTPVAREDGTSFAVRANDDHVPSWWGDAVVYTVFVDRFRRGGHDDEWGVDPGAGRWAGGDLDGIRRSLAYLSDLGVNTLYLTPIHVASSCHRYDLEDPTRVDPSLGGEEAFDDLLRDLHARGMRLVLDWSFSHAGLGFAPYRDVLLHGRESVFADWFQWEPVKVDDEGRSAPARVAHYAGCTKAPLLNLKNPDVAAQALACAEQWMARGVDGLRIDCAAQVPMNVLVELRARVRAHNADAVVVGELVPTHAWRWRTAGALDSSTDFGFYRLAVDRFASPLGHVVDLAARWERLVAERGREAHPALRFISTHDFPRFFSLTRAAGCTRNDALALTWLLTMPGVPMLLYGEEVGMRAEVAEIDPEGVWRDRAPFPWGKALSPHAEMLRDVMRKLLRVRADVSALRHGVVESMTTEGPLWVYRRRAGREVVDIGIHQGEEPLVIALEDADLPGVEPLCKVGNVRIEGCTVTFEGPSAVVLRRTPAAGKMARVGGRVASRDDAFRLALERATYPRRLDVSLTERCNLKCAHCITLAPERTARGTARSATPFVLSRLTSALPHAEHIGFVHGGETLVSPVFFDLLDMIREARGDAPTMVHLLTNGMLLSRAMTERLAMAGVRSISVSLDGARAATNDAVRSGAEFGTIVGHLREAVRVRREGRLDLRLGLSTVVLPGNVDELGGIVDLAADIGLDWVKFEELVPATPYARSSLVKLDDGRTMAGVRAACARAVERGIVAVDHTTPMPRWVCALDECRGDAERHRADEFANRTALNPCRDAWELACIEPNGDVRVAAFHGALAGNLAERDLLEVWNSDTAREERQRARLSRKCWGGEVVCLRVRSA